MKVYILYNVHCDETVEFIGATYNENNANAAKERFRCDCEEIEIDEIEIPEPPKVLNEGFNPYVLVVAGGRITYVYFQHRNLMPNPEVDSIEFRSRSVNDENFWNSGVIYIWGESGVGTVEVLNRASSWYEENRK